MPISINLYLDVKSMSVISDLCLPIFTYGYTII